MGKFAKFFLGGLISLAIFLEKICGSALLGTIVLHKSKAKLGLGSYRKHGHFRG